MTHVRPRFFDAMWLAGLLLVGALTASAAPARAAKLLQRSEVDAKYKWKLEDIYATNDAWDADFKRAQDLLPKVQSFKGKLGQSGATLLAALKAIDEIGSVTENLTVYANMRRDEDNRVAVYQGQVDRITSLNARVGEASAYFTPEVLAIPAAKMTEFYKSTSGLAIYRHNLEDIQRLRAHTLSTSEEKLLASARDFSGPRARSSPRSTTPICATEPFATRRTRRSNSPRRAISARSNLPTAACGTMPSWACTAPTAATTTRSAR